MSKHTLSVLVENTPGVLARITALFSRRGFNIDSLAVGVTEHPDISRITIVVSVEDFPLEQVTKQLNKLVNVLKIVELEPTQAVQRELVLVKVRSDNETRSRSSRSSSCSAPRPSTSPRRIITIEATGSGDKLSAMLRMLKLVRHQGTRPVRHDRHRPRRPFDHGPLAARSTGPHNDGNGRSPETVGRPYPETPKLPSPHRHTVGRNTCTQGRPSGRAVLRRRRRPVRPSRAARSRSSGTAARATPTPCRCATPVSTCASVCTRAPSPRPGPRSRVCAW
ncbi:hypothetical protein STENM327S_07926 [Streptomyces tendae]